MIIQIDSREKSRAIKNIVKHFDDEGIKHISSKLYVGDYMNYDNPYLIIDRKQNLLEVCTNVCQDHDRFRNELINAKNTGIQIVILVEHGEPVSSLADVMFWRNPRKNKSDKALDGDKLYKIMNTMSRKYGVIWEFCNKKETGAKIVEILTKGV